MNLWTEGLAGSAQSQSINKFKESSAPIKCVPEEVIQSVVSKRGMWDR